jgi:hypothetical protein
MSSSFQRLAPPLAVAALLAGCGGDGKKADTDKDNAKAVPHAISRGFARSLPLDTKLERFKKLTKGIEPVKTTKLHQDANRVVLAEVGGDPPPGQKVDEKARAAAAAKLVKRYGPAKNGVVTIPARDFTCLHYDGSDPTYSWKFCFRPDGGLDFVVTGPPLNAS